MVKHSTGPIVSLLVMSLALTSASIRVEHPKNSTLNVGNPEWQSQSYHTISRLRRLAVEFFAQYQNITISDLYRDKEIRLPTTDDLRCLADLQTLAKDVSDRKLWALRSKSIVDTEKYDLLSDITDYHHRLQ